MGSVALVYYYYYAFPLGRIALPSQAPAPHHHRTRALPKLCGPSRENHSTTICCFVIWLFCHRIASSWTPLYTPSLCGDRGITWYHFRTLVVVCWLVSGVLERKVRKEWTCLLDSEAQLGRCFTVVLLLLLLLMQAHSLYITT